MKEQTTERTTKQQESEPSWTEEQQRVIDARDRSLLVSAAAGSGKTAVLVARILALITEGEHPLDVDELLVLTFTNAAAAEMRERLLAAIEKAAAARPTDEHLQMQRTLIHNAQIETIHSFCLHVISNHFHRIGIEPGFRLADEIEIKLLQEEVCDVVLEEAYAGKDPAFLCFADGYASAKNDVRIREMILELYKYARSYPWPEEWLDACAARYFAADFAELEEKDWMKDYLSYLHERGGEILALCEEYVTLTCEPNGPYRYEDVVRDDLAQIRPLVSCAHLRDWQEALCAVEIKNLPGGGKGENGDAGKRERVKALRDRAKKLIGELKGGVPGTDPEMQLANLRETGVMVEVLVALTKAFAARFAEEKAKRGLVDFGDLEHFALRILVNPATKEPTETAGEFRMRFHEVMVDEYQDSNYLQEEILRAVSGIPEGRQNFFMVGDVKQSIYRFRLARPELFMNKFASFSLEEDVTQRIDLHKNFRSTPEVIDTVNEIFYKIMGRDLGNVEYDEAAALYLGRECEPDAGHVSECLLIEEKKGESTKVTEARAIARRVRRLIEQMPQCEYRDVVILLRKLKDWTQPFLSAFEEEGVPLLIPSKTGYFLAREVQTILSMLYVLDNPRQDIPLAALMRSEIGGFADEEMARIKAVSDTVPFYACVSILAERANAATDGTDTEEERALAGKTADFLAMLADFRARVPYTPVHTLLQEIYDETGFRDDCAALPAGEQRAANLDMLLEKAADYEKTSYHGLFHFVRYIDRMLKFDIDLGEAETLSEQENAVRLMTIHKSKGLEFPIVIVAGMGKKFNRSDETSEMVFHPSYGIGLKYNDPARHVTQNTLIRQAFAVEAKKESFGEELRVLYVALTRAKNKLILTGTTSKEYTPPTGESDPHEKLPFPDRFDVTCYFDWILPALRTDGSVQVRVVRVEEEQGETVARQVRAAVRREALLAELSDVDGEALAEIDARFSWEYPYHPSGVKQKMSVSEIKHRAMGEARDISEEDDSAAWFPEEHPVPYIPQFVKDREENAGALRGTAFHRFLERLDFSAIPCFHREGEITPWIAALLDAFCDEGYMDRAEADRIDPAQIARFLMTDAAAAMREAAGAGTLVREQPFVMSVPATQVAGVSANPAAGAAAEQTAGAAGEEDVLIQGIIDAFWEEDDGIVLLDYKTDHVASGEELLARYRAQLALYAEALERRFAPKRVKCILLYSFQLGEVIPERREET